MRRYHAFEVGVSFKATGALSLSLALQITERNSHLDKLSRNEVSAITKYQIQKKSWLALRKNNLRFVLFPFAPRALDVTFYFFSMMDSGGFPGPSSSSSLGIVLCIIGNLTIAAGLSIVKVSHLKLSKEAGQHRRTESIQSERSHLVNGSSTRRSRSRTKRKARTDRAYFTSRIWWLGNLFLSAGELCNFVGNTLTLRYIR